MQCPYKDIQCALLDTSGMDNQTSCEKCEHYPNPMEKLMNFYPLKQILGFLPKTIIKSRKTIFRMDEIFDLVITRDGMDNWVIFYRNERSQRTLFTIINADIHRAAAEMLADLIGNNYIQALKSPAEQVWDLNKKIEILELYKKT
jgi:hypothetical protein